MVKENVYVKALIMIVNVIKAPFLIRGAKQRYMRIKQYHPEIIRELNILFDTTLPLREPYFYLGKSQYGKSRSGERVVFYGATPQDSALRKYLLEDDLTDLCHEESHRYHDYLIRSLFQSLGDPLENLVKEAVAEYACIKVLPKLGFNKIAGAYERRARDAHVDPSLGRRVIGRDEVLKVLLEKGGDFFREFVRSELEGILGKLCLGWTSTSELDKYTVPPIDKYVE